MSWTVMEIYPVEHSKLLRDIRRESGLQLR